MAVKRRAAHLVGATALSATAVVVLAMPASAAPPSNDARSSPQPIVQGEVVNGTTVEATMDLDEVGNSCSVSFGGTGDNTVWYSITPGAPGPLTATMSSPTDQAVAVYDTAGTELVCDDNGGAGVTEQASWDAGGGTTYLISVARYQVGEEGPFTLTVDAPPPPPVDTIETTPPSLDYGMVAVGDVSPEQVVTFTNTGEADVELTAFAVVADGPGIYDVGSTNTCAPPTSGGLLVVPALSSCDFSLVFAPQDVGISSWTLSWGPDQNTTFASTDLSGEGTDGSPPPDVPEAPMALLLPGSTLLLGAGAYLVRRRTHRVTVE